MAVDKLVDSTQLDSDLTDVADEIRTAGGTLLPLSFPDDYVVAIGDIGNTEIKTVSGSIAHFEDALARKAQDLTVAIEPVQSGSGDPSPDNVRPISGWTGANVTRTGKNLFRLIESEMATIGWNKRFPFFIKAGTYRISCQNQFGAADNKLGVRLTWTDKNGTAIKDMFTSYEFGNANSGSVLTFTESMAEQIAYIEICPRATGMTYQQIADGKIMLEPGSTATAYEPYSGNTYPITFPSEAGTVYGGTLDVTTGKLTVDKAYALLNDPDKWQESSGTIDFRYANAFRDRKTYANSYTGLICSYEQVNSDADPTARWQGATLNYFGIKHTGLTLAQVKADAQAGKIAICYELATPIVYDLDPVTVTTLLGTNNVWADTGDSTIKYIAPKAQIPSAQGVYF